MKTRCSGSGSSSRSPSAVRKLVKRLASAVDISDYVSESQKKRKEEKVYRPSDLVYKNGSSVEGSSHVSVEENQRLVEDRLRGLVTDDCVRKALEVLGRGNIFLVGCKAYYIGQFLRKERCFTPQEVTTISCILASMDLQRTQRLDARGPRQNERKRMPEDKQSRGHALKRTRVDSKLGAPLDDDTSNKLWPMDKWDNVMFDWTDGGADKAMTALICEIEAENCTSQILFTGCRQTVCGNLKVDVAIYLKGCNLTPYSAIALLCLKSTSTGCYDSDAAVGEAYIYAQMLLKQAGPTRKSIVVGVSDLMMIRWFRITAGLEGSYSHNRIHPNRGSQSVATPCVRQSLCAFLMMEALDLRMDMDLDNPIHQMPAAWEVLSHLGSGATSHVYKAKKDGQLFAIKVPFDDVAVIDDIHYLEQLKDIEGVPRVLEQINTIFCMQPVGKPVFYITDIEQEINFHELVDILYSAHNKKIVHRDIRPENIMVAKKKLFLIDWGFAAPSDVPHLYAGGIVTASDSVLRQCQKGNVVVYKAYDDLVSLVRCMFLLCNGDQYENVQKLKENPDAIQRFWARIMENEGETWKEAENLALAGDYKKLKELLSYVHLEQLLANTGD